MIFQQVFAQNTTGQIFDPELNQYVTRKEPETKERSLRYVPDGQDFVIVNGKNKFNRALYSTHTGFRVETGDVPEFALYLPRMGGNLSFTLGNSQKTISLNDAAHIESRYRAGTRIYQITDPILEKGNLKITVLPISDSRGVILKIETFNIPSRVNLSWKFGGAADKRFSREGDLGVDPVDCFYLKPEYCKGNIFTLDKNCFSLVFGAKKDRKLIGTFPNEAQLSIEPGLPVLLGKMKLNKTKTYYLAIQVSENDKQLAYTSLPAIFDT